MGLKALLIVTAVIECATGLILLAVPGAAISLLLGVSQPAPEALVVGRIAGVALLSIGVASGSACAAGEASSRLGVLDGLLVYNVAVAGLLVFAGTSSRLVGVALWPAVMLHAGLEAWCIDARLRCRRQPGARSAV